MRVLFFLRHPGYLRNTEPILRRLAARGHTVRLVFERAAKAEGESALLESLERDHDGISHGYMARRADRRREYVGNGIRGFVDYLRYLEPVFADAPKLKARAASRLPNGPRRLADLLDGRPRMRRLVRRIALAVIARLPTPPTVRELLDAYQPTLVVVSPLVDLGSGQSDVVIAARRRGIPNALCVASWDNLTNKGLIMGRPGLVAVWNEAQREEAVTLHDVDPENVAVAGAWSYDHWFDWQPSTSRTEFCTRVGLDAGQPILLYLCSSGFIARHEAAFIEEWVAGVRATPGLEHVGVLVRPHPYNRPTHPDGRPLDLDRFDNAVVYPAAGENPTDVQSRADFYDSIHHCAAVVGVNTSALIESAIVGRRVHTMRAQDLAEGQGGTLHFRYLLEVGGGMLVVAESFEEHYAQLVRAVVDRSPDEAREGFLTAFIRPYGLDTPATPIVVAALEAHAGGAGEAALRDVPLRPSESLAAR